MRRFPRLRPLVFAIGLAASATVFAYSNERGIDPRNFDTSADACQDFYQYANGGWLATNPVPADRSLWGLFDELQERSRNVQHEILQEAASARAAKGSVRQQLGDFWASGMDERAIERAGFEPIKGDLERIAALSSSVSSMKLRGIAFASAVGLRKTSTMPAGTSPVHAGPTSR